jgi:hypothetical protein
MRAFIHRLDKKRLNLYYSIVLTNRDHLCRLAFGPGMES